MHSSEAPSGLTYHHNSDFSGNVFVDGDEVSEFGMETEDGGIGIPAQDILFLAAQIIRMKKIQALEQASDDQVLGVE